MFELEILLHAMLGGLGVLTALWCMIELLNASENNGTRIERAAVATMVLTWAVYFVGGWFYVFHYGADKAVIKAGQWPWAHSFFMETKEHLFFLVLLLATYLPLVVKRNNMLKNKHARHLAISMSGLIVLFALAMEGAGGIIAMGVREGLVK